MSPGLLSFTLVAVPLVLDGARIELGDGTWLERGAVVVDGGTITHVGPAAPPMVGTRIDATGKVLTPGLIEAVSHLGLVEINMEPSANDYAAQDEPLLPAANAADAFNPSSVLIPVARSEGVTAAITSPAGTILWGSAAWVELSGRLDRRPDPTRPIAMFGALGANAVRGNDTRSTVWMRLRQLVADARYYRQNRDAVLHGQAHRQLPPPLQLAALEPVLTRQIPLVLRVNRASDILAALAFARDENLRLIIAGGAESWRVSAELAAARVPVVLTPSDQMPASFESVAARDDLAARLDRAGVPVLISTGSSGHDARRLRQEAGIAVAYGLPWPQALKAVTGAVAEAFGRGAEVGTIAPGKRADLVLWSADPLELTSVAEKVWIAGLEQSLETRQKALARRYAPTHRP